MNTKQILTRYSLILLAISLGIGLLSANIVMAQAFVDYEAQSVRGTGIGGVNPNVPPSAQRAGALRAARSDALRNIIEVVKGLVLTSETIVENSMVTNDQIRTKVEGVVSNFEVVDTRYLSDGSVEVDVSMPLSGVRDAVFSESMFGGKQLVAGGPLCPTCGQPWPAGKPVPEGVSLVSVVSAGAPAVSSGGPFTGLIVDARGLGVIPAMAPKILDENNNEVYGTGYISRDYAVQVGVVGYGKNLDQAKGDERVTNNPLVVKGIRGEGNNRADVVISNADAARIHSAAKNVNFLDQCKVMILLD